MTSIRSAVVTGATGHVGNVLVRALLQRGIPVKVMTRPGASVVSLEGLSVDSVEGDVEDPRSVRAAVDGADVVFHVAGLVSITAGRESALTAVNVEGTRNVVEACKAAGVRRLVYTSSVHALCEPPPGGVLDEAAGFDVAKAFGPYGKSKAAASRIVQEAAKEGSLDAVLVLPTGCLGPFDFALSEAGQLVGMAGRATLPIIIAGGYDWVDVRDVAEGSIAAAERAPTGEAYLLNAGYLSATDLCGIVAKAAGVRAPFVALPLWLAHAISYGGYAWELVTGRRALLTPYAVHTISKQFGISSEKARRELGFTTRPLEQTLVDAWEWLSTNAHSPLRRKMRVAPARGGADKSPASEA